MNIHKILIFALLSVMAPATIAQTEPPQDFKSIFQIISAKNVFSTSFREHIKKMRPLCTERDQRDPDFNRKGTVECAGKTGVLLLDMSGTSDPAVTMIDAKIAGTDKCAYMRSVLVQLYGKPAESKGKCKSAWLVKRGRDKPLVHVRLEADTEENVVYFSNQEEQGP